MKDDKKPSQQMKVNINLYWKYQGIHGCIVIKNILQKYNWKMRKMEVTINLKVFLDHIPKKKRLHFLLKIYFAYNCQGQIWYQNVPECMPCIMGERK